MGKAIVYHHVGFRSFQIVVIAAAGAVFFLVFSSFPVSIHPWCLNLSFLLPTHNISHAVSLPLIPCAAVCLVRCDISLHYDHTKWNEHGQMAWKMRMERDLPNALLFK